MSRRWLFCLEGLRASVVPEDAGLKSGEHVQTGSMQGCNDKQRTADPSHTGDFKNRCCGGPWPIETMLPCLVVSFSWLRDLVDKAQGVASDEADWPNIAYAKLRNDKGICM